MEGLKHKNLKNYIWILPLISGICWGGAGIFVRTLIGEGMENLTIIFFRMLFASIMLMFIILIKDKSLLRIHRRDFGLFAVSGLFGLTLMNALYNVAISEGSLALAAVLLALSPVFVLLSAALVLHEKPTARKILCVVLALAGCILVSGILEAGKIAILVSTEPASAMVIGIICYGENPTLLSVLGLCCNIAAIVLLNLPEKKESEKILTSM